LFNFWWNGIKVLYLCILKQKQKQMEKELEFSVDYDGECEDFTFTIDGVEVDTIEYDEVTNFIKKLEEVVEDFWLSEHRTEGVVTWNENGTMDISFRTYNEPDWGNFDEHEINGITPIVFEYEEVED
jgi:hypothetical protein